MNENLANWVQDELVIIKRNKSFLKNHFLSFLWDAPLREIIRYETSLEALERMNKKDMI